MDVRAPTAAAEHRAHCPGQEGLFFLRRMLVPGFMRRTGIVVPVPELWPFLLPRTALGRKWRIWAQRAAEHFQVICERRLEAHRLARDRMHEAKHTRVQRQPRRSPGRLRRIEPVACHGGGPARCNPARECYNEAARSDAAVQTERAAEGRGGDRQRGESGEGSPSTGWPISDRWIRT